MDLSRIGSSWIARLVRPQSPGSGVEARAEPAPRSRGWGGDRVSLGGIDEQLARLRELVNESRGRLGDGRGVEQARADVRGLLRSIDGALTDSGSVGGGVGYAVEGVSEAVAQFRVRGVDLEPGERLDVEVEVTTSAQTAGLYLSFGGNAIDLKEGADSFNIEIAGVNGARRLQFSSGQTLAQVVNAINTFTDETGVRASATSTGVSVRSSEFGRDEFVSVYVPDGGSIGADSNTGIYQYWPGFNLTIDSSNHQDFTDPDPVLDSGQDVEFNVNGVEAATSGLRGFASIGDLDVALDLRAYFVGTSNPAPGYGFQLGQPFTAFTLVGTGSGGAQSFDPESDRLDVHI